MLTTIPTAALVLLNVIVIVYVLRERERTRAGFFLLINAISLIIWSGGLEIWRASAAGQHLLVLPSTAAILVAANMLVFAGIHPRPLSSFWSSWGAWSVAIVPPVLTALFWNFGRVDTIRLRYYLIYDSWETLWQSEGGLPLVLLVLLLGASAVVFAKRYRRADPGPERNLPKHLMIAVLAPSIFALLFALTSATGQFTLIPSPSLMMAFIAQLGILFVIRQEEVERPLYLSRWIFYSIMVLVGFFISHLIYIFYEAITANVLLEPEVHLTILVTILAVLAMASLPPVQAFFDRVMFRRAWEYRQLVYEAQQEMAEMRHRLRRAERLSVVGEMAARIAHEIKNPLGPIKGYTQMMREKLEEMEDFPQRQSFLRKLSIVAEEVESIDQKVHQLLDLAKKPEPHLELENINKIVERAAILLRLEAESTTQRSDKRVIVREDLDPTLPPAITDRGRLEEALFNICRNGFEASGPGGMIVLRTRRSTTADGRHGIVIFVEDNGPGFSEAARQHLFEPFYTEKSGGTGLGLSIVRTNVDLLEGNIEFAERPGGGTIATLWIPFAMAHHAEMAARVSGEDAFEPRFAETPNDAVGVGSEEPV